MSKPRLGKAERLLKKNWYDKVISAKRALIQSNLLQLRRGVVFPNSKGYGALNYEGIMMHGLYRGQAWDNQGRKGSVVNGKFVPKF